jgi:hypothetical protein
MRAGWPQNEAMNHCDDALDALLLHADDMADLRRAVALLEQPAFSIQLVNLLGAPIEVAASKLPARARAKLHAALRVAMHKAVQGALSTMDDTPAPASTRLHKLATAATGAIGGFFGGWGLLAELPVTTTLMMRAVADIARSEGFSLADPRVQVACIEVFALGGSSRRDDAAESGYYAARSLVAEVGKHAARELVDISARQAGQHAGEHALRRALSPERAGSYLARLIEAVLSRFGIVLSEKAAAQVVPVLSAGTGALLNTLFTDHYQAMARGHFIVMRLEDRHGEAVVREAYRRVQHARVAGTGVDVAAASA